MTIKNIKADKMRYQHNSIGYTLVMLALAFGLIALFTSINYDEFSTEGNNIRVVPNLRVGLEIALGIILLLVTFMSAEKIKFYDRFWSLYGLFALAIVNLLRIFNIPLYDFNQGWIPVNTLIIIVIEYGLSIVGFILAGIISTKKYHMLTEHLKEIESHGNDAA